VQKLLMGGGDSLYLKFWIKVTALVQNRRFSIYTVSGKKVPLYFCL